MVFTCSLVFCYCSRIEKLFPERRRLVKMDGEEAIATKKNKEKLEELNNEQEV